jgi:tetratricopeptide (TPR) repeat protein
LVLRDKVAHALVEKGYILAALGCGEEAVAVYDEVIARAGPTPEEYLILWVDQAFFGKGFVLRQLGRAEEAVAVYDEMIAQGDAAPKAAGRHDRIARALVDKGLALEQLGRNELAIAVYDELVARFDTAPEAGLRQWVDEARAGKERLRKGQ